ncbi:MAG: hypothetical protein JSR72_23835 [Proteobacteria bacterium]|nr:hypothetical protein [Pseudomonadota bacterium]
MIDGVKLRIYPDAQRRMREHALLAGRWRSRGEGKAGEQRHAAKWSGWTFTGDATRCWEVRGSFHKVHHGGTNWQDYTFTQFRDTVAALCDAFGLHDAGLTLATLEVGANIIPPIPTAAVLRSIVLHKDATPVPMQKGEGIQIVHAAYRFKIYDKAAQYREHVNGELLRFELKANKMRTLARCKVQTVADLLDPVAWTRLRAFLLAKFAELLIVEPDMPTEGLRPAQRDLVANAAVPSNWQALNRWTRSRRRKEYTALVQRIQPNGLKPTLRELIAAKLSELNNCNVCTKGTAGTPCPECATFAPRGHHPAKAPRKGQSATFAPLAIRGANVAPTVPVPGEVAHPSEVPSEGVRRCLACGRDISDQDPRSRVCSERIHGKAGKACRNKLSNRSLTLRRMKVRGLLLFDEQPFVAVATSNPPQHVGVGAGR